MPLSHRLHARCSCASSTHKAAVRPFTLPGTSRKYERDRPFQLEHLALDLVVHFQEKKISGIARITFSRVHEEPSELCLDAVDFSLDSVNLEDEKGTVPAHYSYDDSTLQIRIEERVKQGTIVIRYSVKPKRGLYFLSPDEHVRDRPTQIWSQCQDEDARYWFPCHDKPHVKQTTEMQVKVPLGWYALSNGSLLSHTTVEDGEIFHWRQDKPHSSYLVTLTAGDFALLEGKPVENVPITYLVPRGREEDGLRTFRETPAMVAHFAKLTGVSFPWEKYAQIVVSDFIFGGMENTSATTMYEYILLDSRAALDISSDDLIAHELAHQWFGDYVTCRDWSHGWLNEGFATFFEHIDRERRLGLDEYEYGLKGDLEAYITEASSRYQRPVVCQDYETPIDLFDRHLYEKGGWILHMLRRDLGDEVFWAGVGLYLRRHAHGIVETRDLLRAMEEVSGRSLERFFDQWVFRAGHPVVEIKVGYSGNSLQIEVKQTQKISQEIPAFALEIEVDIYHHTGEPRREVLFSENASDTFVFSEEERPRFLVVDPRYSLLGELSVSIPQDMLRHQLLSAPSARGRWSAASALSTHESENSTRVLVQSLTNEQEFWGVRAEAAAALGVIGSKSAQAALLSAISTAHPKVRRAVVSALGNLRKPTVAAALEKVALQDESYLVEAEAARSLGSTRQPFALNTLVEILDRPSWADVIRSGAMDGLAALRNDEAVPHLLSRTKYGVPTRVRRAAIRALPKVSSERRVRETIEDLLEDNDPYLRVDAVLALGNLGDSKARPALVHAISRELDGRVRRRMQEVLQNLVGSHKEERQHLQDELEKLRSELRAIRLRLSKIEAKKPRKKASSTTKNLEVTSNELHKKPLVKTPKMTSTKAQSR